MKGKSPSLPHRTISHSSRRGVALITVLSILAIVSVLVVGFTIMARMDRAASGSYSQGVRTEQLVQAGLEKIILDFRQEIQAGSKYETNTNKDVRYYEPYRDINEVALSIVPRRIGYPVQVHTAIRRSVGYPNEMQYYTNFPGLGISTNRTTYYVTNASNSVSLPAPITYSVSTTNASRNLRSISIERWNKPAFVNTNDNDEWKAFSTNPPDWVYVTRSGILNTIINTNDLNDSRNTNFVIGRYAYVVYDVSGLVDITVAGHSTNNILTARGMTNITNDYLPTNGSHIENSLVNLSWAKKGLPQAADLTLLRVIGQNGQTPIDPQSINSLIAWRETMSAQTYSNYSVSLLGTTNYSGTNFTNFTYDKSLLKSGFIGAMSGNQTFISRQDLIRYCSTNSSLKEFLPLFTTFSREKNAPSWGPRTYDANNSSKTYGYNQFSYNTTNMDVIYGGYAGETNIKFNNQNYPNPNPNLAGVRYTFAPKAFKTVNAAGKVLIYTNSSKATSTRDTLYVTNQPLPVRLGSPVLRKRFPLSRIAWLTLTNSGTGYGPNIDYTNAIRQAFGLMWSKGDANQSMATYATNTNSGVFAFGMPHWSYTSPEGTDADIPTTNIKTLVNLSTNSSMSNARDPDFFETLKASILDGSIGQVDAQDINEATDGNTVESMFNASNYAGPSSRFYSALDMYDHYRNSDLHILQIGANIIDQADEDSFSTAISFIGYNKAQTQYTNAETVYGIESLPYMSHMLGFNGSYSEADAKLVGGTGFGRGVWNSWVSFMVWDVHQNASITNSYINTNKTDKLPLTPMYFRVYAAKGKTVTRIQWGALASNSTFIVTDKDGNNPVNYYFPIFGNYSPITVGSNTWNPSKDVIMFDRSMTNLFQYQGNGGAGGSGTGRSWISKSPAGGALISQTYSNYVNFDVPIALIQAYANARPTIGNGTATNYTNYHYFTNLKPFYATSLDTNSGNCFTLTLTGRTTNVGATTQTYTFVGSKYNYWSQINWDLRPAIAGFSTGPSDGGTPGRSYLISSGPNSYAAQPYNTNVYRTNPSTSLADLTSTYSMGDVQCVAGGVANTNADSRPTFVFQATMDPVNGPWRTYSVVKDFVGTWGTDSRIGGLSGFYPGKSFSIGPTNSIYQAAEFPTEPFQDSPLHLIDPRTMRFNLMRGDISANSGVGRTMYLYPTSTQFLGTPFSAWHTSQDMGYRYGRVGSGPYIMGKGFFQVNSTTSTNALTTKWAAVKGKDANFYGGYLSINTPTSPLVGSSGLLSGGQSTGPMYLYGYADRDGVARPGDAYLGQYSGNANYTLVNPMEVSRVYEGLQRRIQDRPIILNRPYRSVGELGYTFRDLPWKTLDFFTTNSADAALLDTFTSYEYESDVVAGKININTPYPSILAALMAGTAMNEKAWDKTAEFKNPAWTNGTNFFGGSSGYNVHPNSATNGDNANMLVTATNALRMANNIVTETGVTNGNTNRWRPLINISDFITRDPVDNKTAPFVSTVNTNSGGTYDATGNTGTNFLPLQKTWREAYTRGLAETTQTRTWNFMIDIIAQSGRLSGESADGNALNNFLVEGERRYWLHIAIDRYTGEIVDQRLEPVYE